MRDGNSGGINTEPLFREWLVNNNGREQFMNKLVEAMNQAIAGKAWWPHPTPLDHNNGAAANTSDLLDRDSINEQESALTDSDMPTSELTANSKARLKLVTDSYK